MLLKRVKEDINIKFRWGLRGTNSYDLGHSCFVWNVVGELKLTNSVSYEFINNFLFLSHLFSEFIIGFSLDLCNIKMFTSGTDRCFNCVHVKFTIEITPSLDVKINIWLNIRRIFTNYSSIILFANLTTSEPLAIYFGKIVRKTFAELDI